MRGYPAKTNLLRVDLGLLFPVLILAGIGVVMVYSASSHIAAQRFGDGAYFLKRQAIFLAAGIGLMTCCRYVSYRVFRFTAYGLLGLAIVLLGLLYVKGIGYTAGGATRWMHVGPVSFQPSVFATFALIIYLAYSLNKKK
ncbi:MAG: FtsW/RodA/SpoVE family cell cycle protein, partial [Thermodesulfobacteriota bacterium]